MLAGSVIILYLAAWIYSTPCHNAIIEVKVLMFNTNCYHVEQKGLLLCLKCLIKMHLSWWFIFTRLVLPLYMYTLVNNTVYLHKISHKKCIIFKLFELVHVSLCTSWRAVHNETSWINDIIFHVGYKWLTFLHSQSSVSSSLQVRAGVAWQKRGYWCCPLIQRDLPFLMSVSLALQLLHWLQS